MREQEQAQVRRTKQEAKERFIIYVRTKQFMKTRLKGIDESVSVFIAQREIEKRFFIHPYHNRKECLYELQQEGELEMINIAPVTKTTRARYEYRALQAGAKDITLLLPRDESLIGTNGKIMREHLKRVSLPMGAPSTPYFDYFLKFKDQFIEHFFTVDSFAQRVHTPITNFHRTHRPNILIDGMPTIGLDIATMQPLILGKILKGLFEENQYSKWIESGKDIYELIQNICRLETRDQAKKKFFEICFSKPNEGFVQLFGAKDWVFWINSYKNRIFKANPHNQTKGTHTNLSWLLQTTEVEVMRKVWQRLNEAEIVFLSVHDEIIVKEQERHQAESIFRSILNKEFKYYQLNCKQQ